MKTIALASRLNLTIYLAAFFIPLLFTHPQIITGTIVNALIFTAAGKMSKKIAWPVLVLPSLGAVSRGLLFGPLTFFLVYFLPFIWLGNYAEFVLFQLTPNQPYAVRIWLAAAAKYLLLLGAANVYFQLQIVPRGFITSMGLTQLITAVLGGLVAYLWLKPKN